MAKGKILLASDDAQKIQDEIFKKMGFQNKMKIFFKINNRVFNMAVDKIKFQYPNLDHISFSRKLYSHIGLKREYYDNLFNKFLQEELKNNH